jgi:hypothetical protein
LTQPPKGTHAFSTLDTRHSTLDTKKLDLNRSRKWSDFLVVVCILFFALGCAKKDLDLPEVSSSTISGRLSGFSSNSSLGLADSANNSAQNSAQAAGINLSQSLVTAMSCSSATASLYKLDSSGSRVEPALATCALGSDGSYSFNSKSIGVSFSSSTPSETLIVSVSGCTSGVYSRPITGAKDQYVTMGSTVLSYLLNTDNKSKFYSALKSSPANFNSLISTLDSATTLADAYSLLANNADNNSRFSNLFGVAPTALNQASPEVVSNTLPSTASELVSANLAVSVSHFSSSYNVVYAWKLDGAVIGTQADWNWTPTANMQGAHTLSLTIGESDGSGNVDATKPVKTLSQTLTITNNVLPTAPSFSITTPSVVGTTPINTRALTLTIDTGGSKSNCATFSNLALAENDSAAPAASAFTISCTQDGTQNLSYTLASSGDGLKTLRLWAIDASGTISSVASSTFVYLDTGSPTMTIVTTPSALSSNASQTFSFAATDNGGVIDHYECKMDGGSYAACSTPKSYSSLSEADHTFYVKAFDTAGNASNVDSKTWHIDLTAPTLSVSGSPNAITNQLTATFSFSATDSGGGTVASLSCNLDSAGYASCASPYINVLSAGAHTLLIKATDTAGNISAVQSFSWTIDTSLPTVSIASKPASLTNSTSASFTFSGTDTGGGSVASYECNLDSAGYSACTSVKTYTGLSAAAHTIAIRAIDTAGNIGSATSYSWTIDLTTPLASINSGPESLTNSTSASFTFSANPPPAGSITGYECDIDSAGFASCSSPKSYTSLAQGSHTFQVRSIDNNGNRSLAVSQTWTVDTTAPTLTINSNPTSLNNSTSGSFTFSATDSGGGSVASYSCKLDGASYTSCSSPISYSSLAQGSHTFYVTATDSAGNTSSAQTNTWTTDLTAPTITISANPTAVTNSSSANFTFSATDSGGGTVSSYQCSIDGAAYATCTSIKSYTGLAAGSHQFALLAIDTAGNTSSASTYSWTIDTTAPTISITSTPSSPTNATTASFSFSATDSGGGAIASYACKIDAGSYASCTSPTSYSSLAAGAHTFYITSTDTAGNTSSASSVSWTIDLTAPTVAITTPAASAVVLTSNIASYAMSGTCSENGQTVTIAGSVSTTAACASGAWSATVDLSALADGTLSITAAQSDVAGNTTTTASRSFIKDTTAPTISVTTPSTMQGNVSTGSVTWTLTEPNVAASTNFTVEVYNGTSWSSVGTKAATAGANSSTAYTLSSFAVPNVDVTTAKIRVTLADAAGNSTTSQTSIFTIESTAPTISVFTITEGATTAVQNIRVNMTASSTISNITHFCIKANSTTAPSSSDTCWVAVNANPPGLTPAITMNLSNYYYQLGFTSGSYSLYGFVKNQMGLISNLSNGGAGTDSTDKATTNYSSQSPPTVLNVVAANRDDPSYPTVQSDYTISSGGNVFIKWNASDTVSLGSTPISLYYTTDDKNFTLISSGIANTNNASCTADNSGTTIDDSNTGCYLWTGGAPSTYFRIRVVATNAAGLSASNISASLNSGSIKILAGNTDSGVGSSASKAVLNMRASTILPMTQQFVVMPNGMIVLIDKTFGLMKIDPTDGKYQVLITNGGTVGNDGDGNAITNAAVKVYNPWRLTMDGQSNIYVWDHIRIRKINTNVTPWTINTIIGGGSSDTDGIAATSLQLASEPTSAGYYNLFQARPNGYIYFRANNLTSTINAATPPYIWVYNPNTGIVNRFLPGGNGYVGSPSADITPYKVSHIGMSFDPTNSTTKSIVLGVNNAGTLYETRLDVSTYQATTPLPGSSLAIASQGGIGMDGNAYFTVGGYQVKKWDESTSNYTNVLGATTSGYCADGTAASSCKFQMYDFFVDANGKLYINDWGMIRTLDQNNNIITIAGQNLFYGDGLTANSARIGNIDGFVQKSTGEIAIFDYTTLRIRQLNTDGTMSTIAGNGFNTVPNTTSTAVSQSIGYDIYGVANSLAINSSDEVIYSRGRMISKLSSSTGKWVDIAGIGATNFKSGDGAVVTLSTNSYYPKVIGVMGNSVVAALSSYSASYIDALIKSFDMSTGVQSAFAGILGANANPTAWPANGSNLSSSLIPIQSSINPMVYDSTAGVWYTGYGGVGIMSLTPGGTISTLFTDTSGSFKGITLSRSSGSLIVYYCANGKLKKWSSAGGVVALSWPITSMSCGSGLVMNPTDGSLSFSFTQNGLYGIGQYLNP